MNVGEASDPGQGTEEERRAAATDRLMTAAALLYFRMRLAAQELGDGLRPVAGDVSQHAATPRRHNGLRTTDNGLPASAPTPFRYAV